MQKKVTIVGGHFGSGKTEFCLNLALTERETSESVAVIDLDIANPYFRSRERTTPFLERGIKIYGNFFDDEVTYEIPALNANVRGPLEDKSTVAIVDLGGDAVGAKVLVQYLSAIPEREVEFLFVVNKNRPQTATLDQLLFMIGEIQGVTGLKITGFVNNSHFLRETTPEDVYEGVVFCRQASEVTGIPLLVNCCAEELIPAFRALQSDEENQVRICPMRWIMRDAWLDQKL